MEERNTSDAEAAELIGWEPVDRLDDSVAIRFGKKSDIAAYAGGSMPQIQYFGVKRGKVPDEYLNLKDRSDRRKPAFRKIIRNAKMTGEPDKRFGPQLKRRGKTWPVTCLDDYTKRPGRRPKAYYDMMKAREKMGTVSTDEQLTEPNLTPENTVANKSSTLTLQGGPASVSAKAPTIPVQAPAPKPAPSAGQAVTKPAPVMVDLEKIQEEALKAFAAKKALTDAGLKPEEISNANAVKEWIYNENIGNINPRMGSFLPRGETGYFLYTPAYPVTDENRAEHIELCKNRVNTRVISSVKGTTFDAEKVDEIFERRPISIEEARGAITVEDDGAI